MLSLSWRRVKYIFLLIIISIMGFKTYSYLHQPNIEPNITSYDTSFSKVFSNTGNKIKVIYFGFTHCPDVCPAQLAILSSALNSLSKENLSKIEPIFITLDPGRDTSQITKEYASHFHRSIQGITLSTHKIDILAKQYGIIYKKSEINGSSLNYTINHNSYFYFTRNNGELLFKIPHTMNTNIIVHAIEKAIKENIS
ncbi:SCO family protein [Paraphotobacterium marinum]|uniref:SCO family protein n=1 Tax=Paraphotobacterium marinum TaxID=1755811 RepID=A0A220VH94_9GAMM|nr:SCO family protein [Paraphotobacterium marinum]ASK79788.1 SCO family protein [Paraphotobacterium marinum]